VEDEASVRELLKELLEAAGYCVLEASRPAEAIHLVEARREPIDLLITDVVMPDMTGPELARHLDGLRPGLRMLFVSGYTKERVALPSTLDGKAEILAKPFTREELLSRARMVLDRG